MQSNEHFSKKETSEKDDIPTGFYMAWNKNQLVLKKSSSGGVFSALAEYVFSKNGIVFGASLNDKTKKVEHIKIDNINELYKVRLSKYYQSEIKDAYLDAKEILQNNRVVLFTGTPCQIAALYSICGNPNNLLTAEVICHGVTSKFVIDAYIHCREKEFKKKVKNYYFRIKEDDIGWRNGGSRVKLVFADGTSCICDRSKDAFYTGFNKNLILRESCYNCKYSGLKRRADFTMGDFWGVTSEMVTDEEMHNGISLLLVNSSKGKDIIYNLKKYLEIKPLTSKEAIANNRALVAPAFRHSARPHFFAKLKEGKDFNKLVREEFKEYYIKTDLRESLKKLFGEKRYSKIKSLIRK